MGKYLVLADQGGGGHLRHHEAGVEASARCKERRQSLAESRIDQPFKAPLADAGQGTEGDGKKVEGECDGLTVKVASRENIGVIAFIHRGTVLRMANEGVRRHVPPGRPKN